MVKEVTGLRSSFFLVFLNGNWIFTFLEIKKQATNLNGALDKGS